MRKPIRKSTRGAKAASRSAKRGKDEAQSEDPDVVEPTDSLPQVSLDDLAESLREAVNRAGWEKLMPVQAKTIPYVLAKRDLMIQSRTGSGKTGAFMLPILERMDPSKKACQALVLAPTRELAMQVSDQASLLAGDSGVRTVAVYGGVGYGPQIDAFKKGAHVVVGTPGRVLDHLLNGNLSLKELRILVFDEADRMLSIGFYPDMKAVQRYLPETPINGYMFSATFPPRVIGLAGEFLTDPQFLSLSRDHVYVAETEHVYYSVPDMEKDRCLVRIIEIENPDSALIFCNTRTRVHYVTAVLRRFGYDTDELSSDSSQAVREQVLNRVRQGKLRFLAATDVAARGIDLPDLSHVIQYEPPDDAELFVHRAGRTGRAGAAGNAVTLVTAFERMSLLLIAKKFKMDLQEQPLPTEADVAKIVSERATALLEARLRSCETDQTQRMDQLRPLAATLSKNGEQVPLLSLLLDEHYEREIGESLGGEWDLDDSVARRMRSKLDQHLDNRDSLQTERMRRFLPFAKDLARNGEDTAVVAMLLDDFYQREVHGTVTGQPASAREQAPRRGGRGGPRGKPRRGRGGGPRPARQSRRRR